jgi:SRSO17 transposase
LRAARPIRASAPSLRDSPRKLVEAAIERGIPFGAVVADILYGEHRKLKEGLENRGIPYVLAIKPSYAWYTAP